MIKKSIKSLLFLVQAVAFSTALSAGGYYDIGSHIALGHKTHADMRSPELYKELFPRMKSYGELVREKWSKVKALIFGRDLTASSNTDDELLELLNAPVKSELLEASRSKPKIFSSAAEVGLRPDGAGQKINGLPEIAILRAPVERSDGDTGGGTKEAQASNQRHTLSLSRKNFNASTLAGQFEEIVAANPVALDLSHNPISEEGIRRVVHELLPRLPRLTTLDLINTGITDAISPSIANAMRLHSKISQWKLGFNELTVIGAQILAEALKGAQHITRIHLTGNRLLGDDGASVLLGALSETNIRVLELGGVGMTAASGLALENAMIEALRLDTLVLRDNSLGDLGVFALVRGLRNHRILRDLSLRNIEMRAEGAQRLFEALLEAPMIERLDVSENAIGGLQVANALAQLVRETKTLHSLILMSCSFGPDNVIAFAGGLIDNQRLRSLDLSENTIGDGGALALAHAIKQPDSSIVDLSIGQGQVGPKGIAAIFNAIGPQSRMKALDLSHNFGGMAGAQACAHSIRRSVPLVRLLINDNEMPGTSMELIARALARNFILRKFFFGGQSKKPPMANEVSASLRWQMNGFVENNYELFRQAQRQVRYYSSPFDFGFPAL